MQWVSAQKKKGKRLTKHEKKIQKFELQKQAMIDTAFVFQTTHIKVPAISQHKTGGYLNIEDNEIHIQEIDWVEADNSLSRIRNQADLEEYTIIKSIAPNVIAVQFRGLIKGVSYDFSIRNSLADGSELTLSIRGRQTVIYSGKVKPL